MVFHEGLLHLSYLLVLEFKLFVSELLMHLLIFDQLVPPFLLLDFPKVVLSCTLKGAVLHRIIILNDKPVLVRSQVATVVQLLYKTS